MKREKRPKVEVHPKVGSRALLAALTVLLTTGTVRAKDLGDILLEKGVITPQELKEARQEESQKTTTDEKQKAATEESRTQAILAKMPDWLRHITPFGDIRTRWEGFYANDLHARNRFRIRARPGLKVKINDEIGGAIRLATGDPNDPISTNQTLSQTFTRKPISLDQAYLTFTPGKTFYLKPGLISVTAGKFGVNAHRNSELLFDDDLSPEGATEVLSLYSAPDGFLRGIQVNGFQWVIDEVSGNEDPFMGGGQVVADTALGSAAKANLSLGDFSFQGMNRVARTYLNSGGNKALVNSNDVVKDSTGMITGYRYGFNLLTGGTDVDFPDTFGLGVPSGLFGDVVYNTQASSRNVGFYLGAGVGSAGKDYYHDGLKKQGEWGVSYTYVWVQKDAVPSLFSYSDIDFVQAGATQHGGTNVSAHIFRVDYELLDHLELTAKAHFINALDAGISNAALTGNQTLVRTQVDAVLSF